MVLSENPYISSVTIKIAMNRARHVWRSCSDMLVMPLILIGTEVSLGHSTGLALYYHTILTANVIVIRISARSSAARAQYS